MFIQVIAQNPGHQNRYRAKRRFSVGTKYRIEVIDQPEDFLDANGVGDMTRMNRAAFESLKADPQISVLSDGETDSGISRELYEAVKKQATDAASQLASAQVEISRLTLEVQSLQAKLAAKDAPAEAEAAADHEKPAKKGK